MEPASSGKSDKVHRVFFIHFSSNGHFLAFRSFLRLILVVPQSPRGGRLCGELKLLYKNDFVILIHLIWSAKDVFPVL